MEYGIVGLLILALDIYGIIQVINSGASGGAKILWILAILVFQVVGLIVIAAIPGMATWLPSVLFD